MHKRRNLRMAAAFALVVLISISCNLPKLETTVGPSPTPSALSDVLDEQGSGGPTPTGILPETPAQQVPGVGYPPPTPDPYRDLPPLRQEPTEYTVKPNDTLAGIARAFLVGLNTLVEVNQIEDPSVIQPGDVLLIPAPDQKPSGPGFKVLPDSEVVYGPSSVGFDLEGFISGKNGFLASYWEDVENQAASGSEIILRVSEDYSVNPRVLLALLEYTSGWVTQQSPAENSPDYPLGYIHPSYKGLWRQMNWAANEINRGYYLWRVNAIQAWVLVDGSAIPPDPYINAGTAGIQHVFSKVLDYQPWLTATGETGLFNTYLQLFGYPFDIGVEPIVPAEIAQPALQLPFEPGLVWRYTGGPHGAFGGGAAWAALDFAPPGNLSGCIRSEDWVTAMAAGPVVRSGRGQVVQDLDGDGNEQTGWVLVYLHIETRDRTPAGVFLNAGDRIGHPSCEGGISTGTHVHIARRYNGEWIPADRELPFNLEGWISSGTGYAYNGYLKRDGISVQALTGSSPQNQITR